MRVLLIVVLVVSSAACASTGGTPTPFPRPGGGSPETPTSSLPNGGASPTAPRPVRTGGYEISGTALALRGTPYRDGGADTTGFDCSGLVWYVFAQHGLAVPRTVSAQAGAGSKIDAADVRPGDLLFFATTSSGPSHVGIAIGGDSFVHAPSSNGVVRVERLSAAYWSARFLGARRLF